MTPAVLCLVLVLWPPVAFLGGAGFSVLPGFAALPTIGAALPHLRLRIYALAILAFFVFAAASTQWSPNPIPLIDFSNGVAVSEIPRVSILVLATGALIAAAQGLSERSARLVMRTAVIAFSVQVVVVATLTIFERDAIAFFYPGRPDDEGVQNISRNCLIMATAFPFLVLSFSEARQRSVGGAAVAILLVVEVAILLYRGVHAGLLAMIAAAFCFAVVRMFPRSGFRILGGLIVMIIMTAPVVFQFIAAGADPVTAASSMEYRQLIWGQVIEIIWQHPLVGEGVGALRSYRELIPEGAFAGQLYIPNHAHSMMLQLWAETGLVGALLMSAAILLAAFRMPMPVQLGSTAPRVAVLVGVVLAIGVVSYDLWNSGWWGVIAILAVVCVAHSRTQTRPSD